MQSLIPFAEKVGEILLARRQTVAISESSSGGLISAALLSVSGASRFYRGSGIIYTPHAFRGLMGLTKEDLGDMRSSSEPYALLIARTIREKLRADWGLCETGAAGPSGNGYGDPAGHNCVGIIGGTPIIEHSNTLETGRSDRVENMYAFAKFALSELLEQLT
ncbi:MAG: CinA family protein [Pseudomonadota bacterium]